MVYGLWSMVYGLWYLESLIFFMLVLKTAQESFALCLADFQLGFVAKSSSSEEEIVAALNATTGLAHDIDDFSKTMIETGQQLFAQLEHFRADKLGYLKERKKDYDRQT